MAIKPRRWRRGRDLCAYCGVNVSTDGDHVVPDCLYTDEERRAITNVLTVPACRDCNADKGTFDAPSQHYLLADVEASEHPQAKQLFDAKMVKALATHRAVLLDRFHEGRMVSEITASGLWVRSLNRVPIDPEPVGTALVYIVRGLHYLVFGETKQEDEVRAAVIERGNREEVATQFFSLPIHDWHSQGDVFTVAWVEGAAHVYWMFDFFNRVYCYGRSAKDHPLHGPPPPNASSTVT